MAGKDAKFLGNQAGLLRIMAERTGKSAPTDEEATWAGAGTSIFDPVLCELVYTWFCPEGGIVLDPFSGGSVRGVIASKLGRRYFGVDLSSHQIAANKIQGAELCSDPIPTWINGNSVELDKLVGDLLADFVFSCPPYADLEVYSDDPNDLSNMPYDKFKELYSTVIGKAVSKLKPDRFACFVVGDVRAPDGFLRNFPWHTIEAFDRAGARLYNDAFLVTAVGSLPIRVGRQFNVSRKLGRTHQNVLIFCKGDPKRAAAACQTVDVVV